jgi:hypothetical protein
MSREKEGDKFYNDFKNEQMKIVDDGYTMRFDKVYGNLIFKESLLEVNE